MTPTLIDTPAALIAFLDDLPDCKGYPPSLYVDLEGNNLSRQGTISLVTILVHPRNTVHLVDVTTLKEKAFTVEAAGGCTLKKVLESEEMIKAFFDIRHDSDALFALYNVRVGGICDLQLMQLATREFERKYVNGLAKCIERDSTLTKSDKLKWQLVKKNGCKLFDPTQGGDYAVFDERPLSTEMTEYCIQDVVHMPNLWAVYSPRLCYAWWEKITVETRNRIVRSQHTIYNGKGKHMALAPEGWPNWKPTPSQMKATVLLGRQCSMVPGARATTSARETVELAQSLQNMKFQGADLYETNEPEDFAACDSECGYCGHCPY